jgi:hypothetical protein
VENIFNEVGIKRWVSVWRFAAFRPSKSKPDLLGAAARQPAAQGGLLFVRFTALFASLTHA